MKLRQYQHNQIKSIRAAMQQGHSRIVMQLATGGGKTVIFSYMVKQAASRGLRCLILTDRVELLEQAGGTFSKLNIHYDNITAKTRSLPASLVTVAMVETMKRRAASRLDFQMFLRKINLLVIDECHKHSFDKLFQYLSPDCYVIGVTATPYRKNQSEPLSKYFTSLVEGVSISGLIADGYLSKPKYFGVSVDLSNIKMKAGEFDERDQEKLFTETRVFDGLKHNLDLHAKGLKTMIFCPSVRSSIQVSRDLGCLHVDGTIAPAQRRAVLDEFENTPGAIITNVGITTTGYDHPGIECIVLYRATTSLPLYLQMIGRGSRTTDTKSEFTILDFGMNVQRFGYWHSERTWSLEVEKRKSRKKLDTFPVKFCPDCGAIVAVQVRTCEYCGYIWEVSEKERVFAELEQLTYSDIQRRISECKNVEEMEAIRIAKGYKVGFLLHKFTDLDQFQSYAALKGYKRGWAEIQARNYKITT